MLELSLIYEKLQQLEEVPANGKCANTVPAFKEEEREARELQASWYHFSQREDGGVSSLGIHFQPCGQHKDKHRNSQHRPSEGNPCLTSLVAFCDECIGNDEGAGM